MAGADEGEEQGVRSGDVDTENQHTASVDTEIQNEATATGDTKIQHEAKVDNNIETADGYGTEIFKANIPSELFQDQRDTNRWRCTRRSTPEVEKVRTLDAACPGRWS